MNNLWSMIFVDGRDGTITSYDGLEFKVKSGGEFVKAPDDFLPVPTGWLLLPRGITPRAIFFDRILSCAVFFPSDKATAASKSVAMKFYLEEINKRLTDAKKNFDELKSIAARIVSVERFMPFQPRVLGRWGLNLLPTANRIRF